MEVESGKRNDRPALAKALSLCGAHNLRLVLQPLTRRNKASRISSGRRLMHADRLFLPSQHRRRVAAYRLPKNVQSPQESRPGVPDSTVIILKFSRSPNVEISMDNRADTRICSVSFCLDEGRRSHRIRPEVMSSHEQRHNPNRSTIPGSSDRPGNARRNCLHIHRQPVHHR